MELNSLWFARKMDSSNLLVLDRFSGRRTNVDNKQPTDNGQTGQTLFFKQLISGQTGDQRTTW